MKMLQVWLRETKKTTEWEEKRERIENPAKKKIRVEV